MSLVSPEADTQIREFETSIVTGFEIQAYKTISGVTKLPSVILMQPKSVIESDYIYRQEFKEKYGFDPGKYSIYSSISYLGELGKESAFVFIDDFDSIVSSGSKEELGEYIGGALWDACFAVYLNEVSTRISDEILNHQKTTGQKLTIEEIKDIPASKRTASEQSIIDLYEDIDGVYRAEWDLIDKSRAFNVDTALVESYNSQLSVIGSDYAIMLADCRAYSNSLITLTTGNETIVKALLISHYDDFIDGINRYGINYAELAIDCGEQFVNAISTYPQYADDIIRLVNIYENNVIEAFSNGITPEAIISLEEIGLTPDDFYGKGKIRNLKIKSDVDAKALIESRNKIHFLFSDEELRKLKLEVLKEQDKLKDKYTGDARAFTPAVAGVAYRNADGSITYYFGANDYGGNTPKLPDSLQARIDNMDSDIVSAAHEINGAVGSHAEIYAVAEMYEKHPNAKRDDFVIYVNYSRPYNSPTIGHSFYTCEHCKEILDGYNIISNVEGF